MSTATLNSDGSANVRLVVRRASDATIVFTFLYDNGDAYQLNDTFELHVKASSRSASNIILLTEADGLEKTNNTLTATFTETNTAVGKEVCFWRLRNLTLDSNWFSGVFRIISGEAEEVSNSVSATINTGDNVISVTIAPNTGDQPQATTTVQGKVELATSAETLAGTDTERAVVPAALKELLDLRVLEWIGVIATNHGAVADGSTDNYSILQNLIDTYAGRPIIIGRNVSEVFIISRQLILPSNSRIIVGGELKLKNADIRSIESTVTNGSTTVTVSNAGTYFQVGERVVISDDNQPVNGGGAWKTRKVGKTNVIQSIVGSTITFTNAFANILGSGSITAAGNGKIATAEGMFYIGDATNVVIGGNGILNGNVSNRYNIAGAVATITGDEDLRSNVAIGFNSVTDSYVQGVSGKLTIKDFVMHGIATSLTTTAKSERIVFDNLKFDGIIDKAIAGVNLWNSFITNCENINGVDEGEIILYNGCQNVTIDKILSYGNRRYGVAITGQNNKGIIITNCHSITSRNKPTVYNFYFQNQLFGFTGSNLNVSAEEMDATWARSGTTVTVTTPVVHNLTNGQNIWIPSTVVNGGAFNVGVYATITTTSTTTFTFTGINAGFTTGSLTYLGMGADGNIVIASCRSFSLKNLNITNQKMSTVGIAFSANTAFATTTTESFIDGLNIKDFYTGSVANSAISFGSTVRAHLKNVFVDGASRVLNDGSSNSDIRIENFRFQNYTSLFNNNNSSIRLSKGNGSTSAGVAMVSENRSTATIPSGSTEVVVNHFLYKTPSTADIVVTPLQLGNATSWWIPASSIDANTFKIKVDADPGSATAKFDWKIATYMGDITAEPSYSVNYASDFSAGTDSWSSLNTTLDGNIDGIGGVDNTLRAYATAVSGNHTLSKAIARNGNVNRLNFKFYMPTNTNVTGLRIQANGATVDLYFQGASGVPKNQWVELTSAEWTANATTITIYLLTNFTSSFTGAGVSTNDLCYFKDIIVQYR